MRPISACYTSGRGNSLNRALFELRPLHYYKEDTYANNFRHVGLLSSDQYLSTCGYIPQVFALVYCYSVFRKVANIHWFGAIVTIQWGISDRLSILDQINKNTHFITKHVVIKLQYNNYNSYAKAIRDADDK